MANEILVWGEGRVGLWSFDQTIDIPEDYEEIPLGDPFLTRRVKELSETVYVRMVKVYKKRPSARVALLAPREAVAAAREEAERTASLRAEKREAAAVSRARKESRNSDEALAELKRLLPGIPDGEAAQVIERAFTVGSGRVGRSGKLELGEKLELAVRAHIRHQHTNYDHLLAIGNDQEFARRRVADKVDRVYERWRRPAAGTS